MDRRSIRLRRTGLDSIFSESRKGQRLREEIAASSSHLYSDDEPETETEETNAFGFVSRWSDDGHSHNGKPLVNYLYQD